MMHRMLRFPSQWEWHVLHNQRPEPIRLGRRRQSAANSQPPAAHAQTGYRMNEIATPLQHAANESTGGEDIDIPQDPSEVRDAFKRAHPELIHWLHESEDCNHNHISVSELPGGEPVMYGTLLFQASNDQQDIIPLHFWMTRKKLVTLQTDLRLSVRLQADPWKEKLDRCQSSPEAFFIMISCILENFHAGLDGFEKRLGELEEIMRYRNRTGLMNTIFERRYDLLHWNHLFIPIREIQGAAKEAFLETLSNQEDFKRIEHKLDRIESLLVHYAMEIDTLLTMDDAISTFRGNDIMKTLTIFTALFTPATVVGALWGMNFTRLPWTMEPWGFVAMCLVVIVATLIIYWWLWNKGWTGDLLKGKQAHAASALPSKKRRRSGRGGSNRTEPSPNKRKKGNAPPG
ncbi:magnesium transporter CorA family protein [Paenibacillus spongiae]|uniref:Magnesium transporter CorA family protein n=1 Tax=Paenibacillus spongiae TaxID=2909671 RepID=A0ABY5SBV2_9BACL|nr:magnesium transporter CorA family protein [Paenibacillus spongiae]UVI31139.1 magnesium transporter CorA family protein [Paenibacillus spongiae]